MFRYALQEGLDRYPSDQAGPLTTTCRPRLPVTIVCGFLGAGKTTLIRHWLRNKPPARRWVVVLNERGATTLDDLVDDGRPAASSNDPAFGALRGITVLDLADACACCVAEPVLRRHLPRIGARPDCDRVIIELSGQGQPQRIADLLRGAGLTDRFVLERIVTVVAAARATPYQRLDDPTSPVLARALAVAQIEAAGQIWLRPEGAGGHDPMDKAVGAGATSKEESGTSGAVAATAAGEADAGVNTPMADVLAAWRPFGRFVSTDIDAFDAPSRPVIDVSTYVPLGAQPGGECLDRWSWPSETRFSRKRFLQALQAWPPTRPPRAHLHAVLATERETYEWRIEGPLTDDTSSVPAVLIERASAYCMDNRIELRWHDPAARDWLASVATGLVLPAS